MLTLNTRTGSWPERMDTNAAARYLREQHGLPTEPKTLVNRRALRKGPAVRYFGAKPLYDRVELDRWVKEEALQPISPLTRNARRRAMAASPEQTLAAETSEPVAVSVNHDASWPTDSTVPSVEESKGDRGRDPGHGAEGS